MPKEYQEEDLAFLLIPTKTIKIQIQCVEKRDTEEKSFLATNGPSGTQLIPQPISYNAYLI